MRRAPFSVRFSVTLLAACLASALTGCRTASIAVKEQFGYAKREQLVDKVEDARDEQEEAKEQFATTLDRFKALTGFDGGDLERTYSALSREYDRSRDQAEDVRERIDDVEAVANALFSEWSAELEQYSSQELRRASEASLAETRRRYDELLSAMKQAEQRMDPVLAAFGDQVLFLKHNLNARAIASLDLTVRSLETEIQRLIDDMNASIAEADAFIASLNDRQAG